MAACQHILDQPLPPEFLRPLSPSSWNQFAAMKPLQKSSFAEIFGDLLLKQHNHHHHPDYSFSSSVFSSSAPSLYTSSDYSSSSAASSTAGDTETEPEIFNNKSPGSESSDEEEELTISDLGISERPPPLTAAISCRRHSYAAENRCSEWKRSKMIRAAFPPPISCIGRSGKPWVLFKSYRENGRFILKEIRIPTQEFMHACRKDGRLKLHIIQSDDEIPDEDEDDENDDGTEEQEEEVGDGEDAESINEF